MHGQKQLHALFGIHAIGVEGLEVLLLQLPRSIRQ